jgi:hypothetical protein
VWTSVDCELDGGFAAGLIAGDGYFTIRPNNAGSSWLCALAVRLRADDTPLLARLCRWSGVGKLAGVAAQGNSNPQTCWTVQRQADCLRAISILDRHRLLGKKLGEYAIWRTAVAAWTGNRADRHREIARCRERLRAYRAVDNVPGPSEVSITQHSLLAFLAGFVTAEAHFGASPEGHPCFTINLRNDDREILRLFRDRLDIGRLADVPPYRTSRAAVSWRVGQLSELRELTRHLDQYPPRGRVLRIYEAWRDLVLVRDRGHGKRRELAARVRERRAYKPGLTTIVNVDPLEERRARQIAVLRAWAAATPGGARTGTAYEAWRRSARREAPQGDTVAAAFGSWLAAIDAAGLNVKGCRPPAANSTAETTADAARVARQARQRAVIVSAVRRCARELGRSPRATEFFAWRNRFAPEVPSHMTVYRVCPDGWQSVVESIWGAGSPSSDLAEPAPQALHVAPASREQLARVPDVQPGSSDQLRHEGVACDEVAARERE